MLKKIKCMLKGHRFLMRYHPTQRCYRAGGFDRCERCSKLRGLCKRP